MLRAAAPSKVHHSLCALALHAKKCGETNALAYSFVVSVMNFFNAETWKVLAAVSELVSSAVTQFPFFDFPGNFLKTWSS
jgi:hypothetical protein